MHHWMFNCHEVTRLVSESLDRKLPLYQRMGIRMHLLMCKFCSQYRKQLLLMKEILTRYNESDRPKDIFEPLSEEARKRMKHLLSHLEGHNHVH